MEQFTSNSNQINVAQIWSATHALGPGLRSVIWTQGCIRKCSGCISPEWIPRTKAIIIAVEKLATMLINNSEIDGLTISGGEPMLQAAGLASLIKEIRKIQKINVICFTGFTYEQLLSESLILKVQDLLSEVDVLIDGPYISQLDDNLGLRGSSNQRIIHLTNELKEFNFESEPRHAEIYIQNGFTMMVGIPPQGVLSTLDQTMITRG